MGLTFSAARISKGGNGVAGVQRFQHASNQTFILGAVLVDTAGNVQEATAGAGASGANTVVGIAAQPASSGPGFGVPNAGDVLVTTGRNYEVSVWMANDGTTFAGRMVNGGTDPVTPVVGTHVGVSYGLSKVGSEWVVNQADVTNLAVRIVDCDPDTKTVYFKFLSTVLKYPI